MLTVRFLAHILTHGGFYRAICLGKVYFNARFDDVMLIVKREMASMLGGPLPATLWGLSVFISTALHYEND